MNTQQETIVEEMPDVQQPGLLLKQQREALGLSQQQVADRLRLRVAIIRNIEDNEFDSDLVATFTRGYLRSYAKAVGLSTDKVLEAYELHYVVEPQEQKMQSFSRKTKREQHDSRIMLITWVIVLIIIGMSSLWWWQHNQLNNNSSNERASVQNESTDSSLHELDPVLEQLPTLTELTSQEQSLVNEVNETNNTSDPALETMESRDSSPASQPVEPADQPSSVNQVTKSVDESAVDADANLLSMRFSADCWIQVKDATGRTLATGVKKAGESVDLRGEPPLSVILGAPEGVSVTFASEPVDLSGYTAGRVARFTLP